MESFHDLRRECQISREVVGLKERLGALVENERLRHLVKAGKKVPLAMFQSHVIDNLNTSVITKKTTMQKDFFSSDGTRT